MFKKLWNVLKKHASDKYVYVVFVHAIRSKYEPNETTPTNNATPPSLISNSDASKITLASFLITKMKSNVNLLILRKIMSTSYLDNWKGKEPIKSALLSIWKSNILKAIKSKCGEASVVSIDTIHCHNAKDTGIHHTQKNDQIIRICGTVCRQFRRYSRQKHCINKSKLS